ncbi:hypothetical protein [Opitutus sp. GAS368]|jgi:hypothetical protein|uniref:hypothetical protein n=1 Tax=Opitutus sp. GAS368 TaxID=1882749 RepID=UPI00087D8523|nr:hypothetical protein [Opitutus sp. GAS368]SDS52790.1 hypothetical protein SAMN05444173_3163 [Opitutus sp. GAS368]
MELSLESLNSFRPKTGTLEQWNAAYVRVEDYLRAHRIHNRLHQSRLIQRVLSAAAGRHEQNPALNPVTLAIEETDRVMDGWFAELLGEKGLPHDRIAAEGRVALLVSDGTSRWPFAFLDDQNIPAEFASAMKQGSLQAGPDLAVSSMVPRDIDLGAITEAAGQTLERIESLPVLRVVLLWAVFLAVLTAVFFATR